MGGSSMAPGSYEGRFGAFHRYMYQIKPYFYRLAQLEQKHEMHLFRVCLAACGLSWPSLADRRNARTIMLPKAPLRRILWLCLEFVQGRFSGTDRCSFSERSLSFPGFIRPTSYIPVGTPFPLTSYLPLTSYRLLLASHSLRRPTHTPIRRREDWMAAV